jgi:hypothetical protein
VATSPRQPSPGAAIATASRVRSGDQGSSSTSQTWRATVRLARVRGSSNSSRMPPPVMRSVTASRPLRPHHALPVFVTVNAAPLWVSRTDRPDEVYSRLHRPSGETCAGVAVGESGALPTSATTPPRVTR